MTKNHMKDELNSRIGLLLMTVMVIMLAVSGFTGIVCADTWTGNVASGFAGGDGTSSNPYQINTCSQLAYLAHEVNQGSPYAGKYFEVTDDLDLNFIPWTPIGWVDTITDPEKYYSFRGTFDGDNHKISNLYINEPGVIHRGLFGFTGGATIKNLRLINVSVTGSYTVGGLVAENHGGTIDNCYVTGDVTGKGCVGGLVGLNYCSGTTITNCYVTGTVEGSGTYIGGLLGQNYIDVMGTCKITDCYTTGDVISSSGYVGGLIGENCMDVYSGTAKISITNCYATGNITGGMPECGGLVGQNYIRSSEGTAEITITNCYATGTVTGNTLEIGGLVGQNYAYVEDSGTAKISITNCYATGTVTGTQYNAGGLVGINSAEVHSGTAKISITNCYATGDVYGDNSVGGLVGQNYADVYSGTAKTSITNCYATGTVTGNINVGGLVGCNDINALITNSVALNPSVSATSGSNIGRVDGYNEGTLENNYANESMMIAKSVVNDPNGVDGSSKSLAELETESTYNTELGWSFTDTWIMGEIVINSYTKYPILTWQKKDVTFDSNGGSPVDDKYVITDTAVSKPTNPIKSGFKFDGWYKNIALTDAYDFTSPVTTNLNLYAKWTANTYTVTFNGNGNTGGEMSNQIFTYGLSQNLRTNSYTKTGYNFVGWATTANGEKVYSDKQNVINLANTQGAIVNLYAKWELAPEPTPTKSSGGSTDTGSGEYTEYPRTVSDSDSVSFGTSPIVTGVILSDKTSGQITLNLAVLEFNGLELKLNLINNIAGNEEYETEGIKNAPVLYSLNDGIGYKFRYIFKIDSRLTSGEVIKIEFKIPLSEFKKHEMTPEDVIVYHGDKDGKKWMPLDTYLVKTDGSYAYYYAETDGVSPFGIMFMEDMTIILSEPVVTTTETQKSEPEPTYVEPTYTEPTKTAVPTPEQTKSPVGLVGLGLGLLGAFAVLRRK